MIADSAIARCVLGALCCAILGLTGCRRPAEIRSSPFPPSNEVAGWARTAEVRTFSAADLWKYIDGEAERYLKAGVQSVSTADYKFNDRFDAVVDIYTMTDPSGPAKILESEPAANVQSAHVGDDSRLYSQSLVFRKGRYLARITAYQESAEIPPSLVALGRAIEQRLSR